MPPPGSYKDRAIKMAVLGNRSAKTKAFRSVGARRGHAPVLQWLGREFTPIIFDIWTLV